MTSGQDYRVAPLCAMTGGLFFLTVLTVAKYLDGKFIGFKLAFLAYLF